METNKVHSHMCFRRVSVFIFTIDASCKAGGKNGKQMGIMSAPFIKNEAMTKHAGYCFYAHGDRTPLNRRYCDFELAMWSLCGD